MEETKQKLKDIRKFYPLAISNLGLSFAWSIQFGYVTPYFLELGISTRLITIIWTIGPLSGLLVQPIIGYLSDLLWVEGIGQRRPFLFFGTFFVSISLVLFSFCEIFDHYILLAVICFLVLDVSLNVIQVSVKTLTLVEIPQEDQGTVNSLLYFFGYLGDCVAFILGSINFVGKFPIFVRNIRILYMIGGVIVIITCSITFLMVSERKGDEQKKFEIIRNRKRKELLLTHKIVQSKKTDNIVEYSESETNLKGKKKKKKVNNKEKFFNDIKNKDHGDHGKILQMRSKNMIEVFYICVKENIMVPYWIQFFFFFGKYFTNVFASNYIAVAIYKGDPTARMNAIEYEIFESGVRFASFCYFFRSLVALFFSNYLRKLFKILKLRHLLQLSQAIQFFCLISFSFVSSKMIILLIFCSLGVIDATPSIGWIITKLITESREELRGREGSVSAIFNSSHCFPKILGALMAGIFHLFFYEACALNPGILISFSSITSVSALIYTHFSFDRIEKLQAKQDNNSDLSKV